MTNTVNPDYYNKYSATVGNVTVYPIDLIGSTDFDLGNVFKYLLRWQDKGQTEDLKKALTYLEHYENKQHLSKEDEIYQLAAKNLLFNDLKDNNPLLEKFIDLNEVKVKDSDCLYGNFRGLPRFKEELEQVIHNLDRGLQPITKDDISNFISAMEDFSSFALKIYNDFFCKSKCNAFPKLGLGEFTQFKDRLERIKFYLLDAPVALSRDEFASNCHLVLEYIRDTWLACFFSAITLWPNKSILDIPDILVEAKNDNSSMLTGKLLLDTETIKKDIAILMEIYKDYREFRRKQESIPILDLIYQIGVPYDFHIFGFEFFPTILKVLYQEKNAPTMN